MTTPPRTPEERDRALDALHAVWADRPGFMGWLTTVDHKRVARRYIVTAIIFFALAGAMAIVSGVVCVAGGLARFGFVTELLSKPIRYGYMNGIALSVLISQLPKLFGFSIESSGPFLR